MSETETEPQNLVPLLDDLRRELGEAVDELDRARAAHRRVESLLLAVLDHVPVPVVVVDRDLRMRAVGAAAEREWGATLDAPLSAAKGIDPAVAETCRALLEAGHVPARTLPDGYGIALTDEPGTDARYATVWAGSRPA